MLRCYLLPIDTVFRCYLLPIDQGDAAFWHTTAGEGIGRTLQRGATRGQQSTTILSASAVGVGVDTEHCYKLQQDRAAQPS